MIGFNNIRSFLYYFFIIIVLIAILLLLDDDFQIIISSFVFIQDSIFSFFEFISTNDFNSAFLSDLATLEAGLIGVAIPIALNVVNSTSEKYEDPKISRIFTEERLYILQYWLLLPNIILAIFFRFLDIELYPILFFIFFWFIFNIYFFYKFIKLVEKYTVNTDELLRNKLKEEAHNILKK